MGYHAIGIGDDDLSVGKKFLADLSKMSNVPFLSSNVMDQDSNKPLFQRYIIKEVNGLKIGIFPCSQEKRSWVPPIQGGAA
jgi:2',3'-cyclic-nucleotide 2'-phosphodiesterase (5'-nucleotidase family)